MKVISFRVSDPEDERLRAMASTASQSVSELLRERVFGASPPLEDDSRERISRLEAAVFSAKGRRLPVSQLFEYAVILQPKVDKDGEEVEAGQIIVEPTTVLARDEGQAQMLAARAIPDEHAQGGKLDRLQVVVRPF